METLAKKVIEYPPGPLNPSTCIEMVIKDIKESHLCTQDDVDKIKALLTKNLARSHDIYKYMVTIPLLFILLHNVQNLYYICYMTGQEIYSPLG